MISQLLSQAKIPSIFDLGAAAPAEGGKCGKTGGFSSLLAALGGQSAAAGEASATDGEVENAASDGLEGEPATGNAAADIAASGNILPVMLPVLAVPADGEAAEDAPTAENPDETHAGKEAALAAAAATLASAQLAAPATAAGAASEPADPASTPTAARGLVSPSTMAHTNDRASAPVPSASTKGEAAPAAAVTLQVAPMPAGSDQPTAVRETAATIAKGAEPAAGPQVAGQSGERSAQRDPSGEQRGTPELIARPAAKAAGEAPTQFAASQAAPTAPAVVQAPTGAERVADGAQPISTERPALETQVARELSRIVDSLSAAREALTAKTATLAFDHAEFGELSLRFDQRRDGQLAVQLSAANPDAHRAVAAAVAERPAFAQSDTGTQQQAQSGANANSNSSGSARGGAADRDGNAAGNNGSRNERQDHQRGQARADDTNRSGGRRSGTFA